MSEPTAIEARNSERREAHTIRKEQLVDSDRPDGRTSTGYRAPDPLQTPKRLSTMNAGSPERLTMKKTLLVAAALALAFVIGAQTAKTSKHRVVFQLNEAEGVAWGSLVKHVNNTRAALAKDGGSRVEVVFWGQGLNMLRKTNVAYEARLKQLSDDGVTLSACRNAMRLMNVKTGDLLPFVSEVDSGIAEVVRKEESGWAYIH
jgi:intracellular sulfur oxidation DsrE/DsrF family protein